LRACHIQALVAHDGVLYLSSMDSVLAPALPALLPGEGGLLAVLWATVMEHLRRSPSLAEEDSPVARHVKAAAAEFGGYVLEAEERADIVFRVDTLLDDEVFCQRFYGEIDLAAAIRSVTPDSPPRTIPHDWYVGVFSKALGQAAVPHLRELQRLSAAASEWLRHVVATVPAEALSSASSQLVTGTPLGFLSSMPVPVARSLLATLRCDVLALSSASLVFQKRIAAPWLGLSMAELWATELREYLALCASAGGTEIPFDLVPADKRFDLAAVGFSADLTDLAYKQFDAAAERSGEPVFPPFS
jgi:hypothetical protein